MLRGESAFLELTGPSVVFIVIPQQDRLIVSDPTALQYILNSPDFFLGPTLGAVVNLMFGESSVICARCMFRSRNRDIFEAYE
jgi:hypothetical protein